MRYRLRTLLIAVTVFAVLAAIVGAILDAWMPTPISRSALGRQAIKQISTANQIRVEIYIDGAKRDFNLTLDSKTALLDWLNERYATLGRRSAPCLAK